MGSGSVSRVDTAATWDVALNVAPCAVRRCSANSFRTSNLLCAWLDAENRASTAQRQAIWVVIRGSARISRRCGDVSLGRMCIAISLIVFGLVLESARELIASLPRNAIYARKQLIRPELCSRDAFLVN